MAASQSLHRRGPSLAEARSAAVGAERHARDAGRMPARAEDLLARGGVPELHRLVARSRRRVRRPSGLYATHRTPRGVPARVSGPSWPVAASQSFTVPSEPAEAIRRPSGLNATSVYAARGMTGEGAEVRRAKPLGIVPVEAAGASRRPSGLTRPESTRRKGGPGPSSGSATSSTTRSRGNQVLAARVFGSSRSGPGPLGGPLPG